ncbi:MAG: MFS transporter, partial [Spirochaetales bacterium]|nr:MFS transporter [Candidatus Physcosoma equi]
SHILINNYTLQIVQTKGGSSREMGIATSIAAFAEMPTMFLFSFYLKRMKCRTMLYVSGVFFTLKCFGSYLVKTMMGFYAVQFLQMFGWGLLTVALVYYVNEVMDQRDSIKGQGYAATAYTLGSVIGALFGGSLADRVGIDAMLLFGTVVAAVGTIIIFFSVREKKAA